LGAAVFDNLRKRLGLLRSATDVPPTDLAAQELLPGAYRVHRPDDIQYFTELAEAAFPAYSGRIACFGADWLGLSGVSPNETDLGFQLAEGFGLIAVT
jgi:hypothetical protein